MSRITAVVISLLFLSPLHPSLARDTCSRIDVSDTLLWFDAGAVTENGQLLVGDAFESELKVILPDGSPGNSIRSLTSVNKTMEELERPIKIKNHPAGYLLEEEVGSGFSRLSLVTPDLQKEAFFSIKDAIVNPNRSLNTLREWVPINNTSILALAVNHDINKENWWRSLVLIDLPKNSQGETRLNNRITILHDILAHPDPQNIMPGYPYIHSQGYLATTNENTGFFLQLHQNPVVLTRVDAYAKTSKDLDPLPAEFRQRPEYHSDAKWSAYSGLRQITRYHEILEASSSPISIHGWNDRLFLLAKSTLKLGLTRWWLIELDTNYGYELDRTELPTTAAHLSVVVQDEQWIFAEKDPVVALGKNKAPYFDIDTLLILKASDIQNALGNDQWSYLDSDSCSPP